VTAPFTAADLDSVTQVVADAWRTGLDRDWSVRAGTIEWSCLETADHMVDAVLAVAFFLASRKQDGYPEWGWPEFTAGPNARPGRLIEALETVGRVLSAVVMTAEPDARAVIWRRPKVTTAPASDFPARGALEMILHAQDVCAGLGVELAPPSDVCERLREHTRTWPHWTTPGWHALAATDDPWADLLDASGRSPIRTDR
jgi:hypothetical protein